VNAILKKTSLILFFVAAQCIASEDNMSYLESDEQFIRILDKNREAEAWATCAVVYSITASYYEDENQEQAAVWKNQANGATLAVAMSHFSTIFEEDDVSKERFESTWELAQVLAKGIPETRLAIILADKKSLEKSGSDLFPQKLAETLRVCHGNLEAQQAYIDLWRELFKTGMLKSKDRQ